MTLALASPLALELTIPPGGGWGAPRPLRKGTHLGLDFAAPAGTPVYSATDGTVARVGFDPPVASGGHGGGNYAIVRTTADADTFELGYMHLATIVAAAGDALRVGAQLGTVGATGTVNSGPHLHFQLKRLAAGGAKTAIDPTPLFRAAGLLSSSSSSASSGGVALLLVLALAWWRFR